jgi:minimal CRISPR polymerase domain
MTTLIIHGNKNQFTFANSIVAANAKAVEVFQEPLTDIYVIHSTESDKDLRNISEWLDHLRMYGIGKEQLIERVIEVTSAKESIKRFVDYLEIIIKGSPDSTNLIFDLTNGTTFQKNVLSIASYILDVRHQYVIDIVKLSEYTKERGFLSEDILSKSYISLPECSHLDNIAYLNLSEMVRYKRVIDQHADKYVQIDEQYADERFFKDNLFHSIQLKLRGDITKDNAIYRIAASSIGVSMEELISLLFYKLGFEEDLGNGPPTFGRKLKIVENRVKEDATPDFDIEFFKLFNNFILYLRNSSTHKGKLLTNLEKFKADLSVKMAFPFMEFYTEIVYPMLTKKDIIKQPKHINKLTAPSDGIYYYGLDGDNTGAILEELFLSSSDEKKFRKLSKSVTDAIIEISKLVKDNSTMKDAVVFAAGDDLLFSGAFNIEMLQSMQKIYKDRTGLTCSIGYGKSFQEVYLALKLAKTEPGKNSISGVEIL